MNSKRIKEIALNVDTSRVSSPHVKGKQKYYSGYSGGMMDSAASSYSTYMNSKKYPIEEEPDIEEEEMTENNILRLRIKTHKGYSLNETLAEIEKEVLSESFVGDKIQQFLTVALMSLLDDVTGETSGLIAAVPILYKNVYELHSTNKKIDAELKKSTPDKKQLLSYRQDLIKDITDIINALVIALPLPGIDSIGAAMITMLSETSVGMVSDFISEKFKRLSESKPMLAKILYVLGYPFGGPVIFKAIKTPIIKLEISKKVKFELI